MPKKPSTSPIYANTLSIYPTHFLRAVELIQQARAIYNIASENWPDTSQYRFGIPGDYYYAEIWTDGMDWQPNYWVIETENFNNPCAYPFIIFDNNKDRNRFNDLDFGELVQGMLFYRRNKLWVRHDENEGRFGDTVWSYLHIIPGPPKIEMMGRFHFKHASQERVEFWANEEFIPDRCKKVREKTYVNIATKEPSFS